ncbi:hypothetical protein QBC39DRAFT_344097 [Podospora conica]|nr:hypothetical protein QBC39DRAFT_344097 [Schizothecium conicum]
MGAVLSVIDAPVLIAVVIAGLYFLRRRMLPKPIPNIPFNHDAASKTFGDVPELMGYVMRTKRVFGWLTALTGRHQSPIAQAFIKPMAQPWVVVTDPYEAQDILLRRFKEFDRSAFFGELIGGILPEQHIQFQSHDSRFRNNRNLINHLMAPTFVTQISGPRLYTAMTTMIRLWSLKCGIAKGHPFSAHGDITFMALDTIFAGMFGHPVEDGITIGRLNSVQKMEKPVLPSDDNTPVPFPEGELPAIFSAALTLSGSVMTTQLSPVPRPTSWVLRQLPYMKKATAIKDKYIHDKVDESLNFMAAGETTPRTALHSVLLRERDVATKENRKPAYHSRAIADEFFGFMLAGHDTTATTIAWGIKYLADHSAVQTRLRAEMRAALPDAAREKRTPTYAELSKAHVPYLDAVVEEVLRHANTIAFVVREALKDTMVMGRMVPKGTDVFLMANGAGYLKPKISVSDKDRSPGARKSEGKSLTGLWDDEDVAEFKPERWLKKGEEGAEVFDPAAGPQLAFGLGPRACFGKKFALFGLKMQFALINWHFDLLEVPEELGGYEAVQKFAQEPTKCFARLKEAEF